MSGAGIGASAGSAPPTLGRRLGALKWAALIVLLLGAALGLRHRVRLARLAALQPRIVAGELVAAREAARRYAPSERSADAWRAVYARARGDLEALARTQRDLTPPVLEAKLGTIDPDALVFVECPLDAAARPAWKA